MIKEFGIVLASVRPIISDSNWVVGGVGFRVGRSVWGMKKGIQGCGARGSLGEKSSRQISKYSSSVSAKTAPL